MISPPLSCVFLSMAGRMSGSWPLASRRFSQVKKSQITNRPASTSHTVGERWAQDGPPSCGRIQPHSPERRIPKTSSARPAAERTAPTRSNFGRVSTGASTIRPS